MRFRKTKRALLLTTAICAAGIVWAGCSPKKQTEMVPGVSTQVRVPKDLKSIRLDAVVSGQNVFCGVYDVTNGVAKLPRTLALQSSGKGNQITVYVTGYQQASTDPNATQDQQACAVTPLPVVKTKAEPGGTSRILRAAKTNYLADRVLFLPMPLKFSCFDMGCATDQDQVCKGGRCVPNDVNENSLVDYNDNLIYGNSSTCFSPALCMPDAVAPLSVDPATCKFALPKTPGAPDAGATYPFTTNGTGLNVRAFYDDGTYSEILDFDKDEGFFIPDPVNAPQTFQLADGLCKPDANAVHHIVGVISSGLCPPKTPLQPICDEESPSNPDSDAAAPIDPSTAACSPVLIHPAPSALVVLLDDTPPMGSAFFSQDAAKTVLKLSLEDPVFETTTIGFSFTPSPKVSCSGFDLDIPFDAATTVQQKIADQIAAPGAGSAPPPLALSVALSPQGAYKKLADLSAAAKVPYNKLAVVAIGNGDFGPDCGSGVSLSVAANAQRTGPLHVTTYALLLGRTSSGANTTGLTNASALAGSSEFFFNADDQTGGDPARAFDALAKVTADIASCVYDAPADLKGSGAVSYFNPLPPYGSVKIPFNASCSASSDTQGWNLETVSLAGSGTATRVRVCGSDCANLRSALKNTAALAAQARVPAPAIPIYVNSCTDKGPTPTTDGGTINPDAGVTPPDSGTDSALPDTGPG